MTKIKIEKFDEVPSRQGGGGGRRSELLDAVRSLNEGQKVSYTVPEDQDFNARTKSIRSSLYQPDALDFRPRTRTLPEKRIIEIYREAKSEYARNANGEISTKNGRRLTLADKSKG